MGAEESKTVKFKQFNVDLSGYAPVQQIQHQLLGTVKQHRQKDTSEEVLVKEVLIPEDKELFKRYIEKMQKVMRVSHPYLLRIIGSLGIGFFCDFSGEMGIFFWKQASTTTKKRTSAGQRRSSTK